MAFLRESDPPSPEGNISSEVPTSPIPRSPEDLYLDLLKRTLSRAICARYRERQTIDPGRWWVRFALQCVQTILTELELELVRVIRSTSDDYVESGDAAKNRMEDAETMLGTKQLDSMQSCIDDVLHKNVPGDLVEAGVWRGGMTILMRAALKARGDATRLVWVIDSFSGLPEPEKRQDSFGWRQGDMAVSLETVKGNFMRYGLLDSQVVFVKGFFSATLPQAPIGPIAILRVDADLYESTTDALNGLYHKLSIGGYAIFDDYQNLADCRRAIEEFRDKYGISDPIVPIDRRAVYWQKSS